MNPFRKLRKDIERAFSQRRIETSMRKAILRYKQVIIDTINVEQLAHQGIRGDGVSINSFQPYAKKTVELRKKKGLRTDIVTLDDTGNKYLKSKIKPIKGGIEVFSTAFYFEDLAKRYGKEIFQLTEENRNDFTRFYIIPQIVEDIKAFVNR